jgi:methylthioribose-1-phosphate isomerase
VIYLNDCSPQELVFGCQHHNIFFKVAVYSNYNIGVMIADQAFFAIRDLLRTNETSSAALLSKDIFVDFAPKIPVAANRAGVPTHEEILNNSRDVEESEKIYFCGWLIHDGVTSRPTPANLAKTMRACGQEFFEFCKKYNISSRWTDIISKRVALTHPPMP